MKGNVSLDDIYSLRKTVSNCSETDYSAASSFKSEVSSAYSKLMHTKEVSNGLASEAKALMEKHQQELEHLIAQKEDLESELAATPPTITIVHTDSEGNSWTEEVPNPKYAALESEIASVDAKIEPERLLVEKYKHIMDANLANAQEADRLASKCKEIEGQISSKMGAMTEISSGISKRLGYVYDAVNNYKSVSISYSQFKPNNDHRLD